MNEKEHLYKPEDADVIILCGGLGKQLSSPSGESIKPLVHIGKRPLLEILIDWLAKFGFRRFILAIGHQGKDIETYFQVHPLKNQSLQLLFSYEAKPLGTAGAVKHCEHMLRSKAFLVLNGDSYCALDFRSLFNFHQTQNGVATLVVVSQDPSRQDGDYVELGEQNRILSFHQKQSVQVGYLSAGIYVFDHSVLNFIQKGSAASLENDIFPKLASDYLYAFITPIPLYDIGTGERLEKLKQVLS